MFEESYRNSDAPEMVKLRAFDEAVEAHNKKFGYFDDESSEHELAIESVRDLARDVFIEAYESSDSDVTELLQPLQDHVYLGLINFGLNRTDALHEITFLLWSVIDHAKKKTQEPELRADENPMDVLKG